MGNPYIGEIRMFAGNFAPNGWMLCQGQTVAISDYDTLFNLIGTTYGGDGQETFNLPNLQSRVVIGSGSNQGNTYVQGQAAGAEQVTLNSTQIPVHNHTAVANANAGSAAAVSGAGAVFGATADNAYGTGTSVTALAPTAVGPAGNGQPHTNIKPYLCVNFIISMFGIYPSPN